MLAAAIVLGLLPALAAPPQGAPSSGKRALRVGLHDAAPFADRDEEGAPAGFAVDVLRHVADLEGRELEFVPGTWSECMDLLEGGEIDLLLPIRRDPRREARMDFSSEGMLLTWGSLFTLGGKELSELADLEGEVVVAVHGDAFLEVLQELLQGAGITTAFLEVEEVRDGLPLLRAGRANAFLLERFCGLELRSEGLVESLPILGASATLHVAAPHGRYGDFLDDFDRRLAAEKDDPTSYYHQRLDAFVSSLRPQRLPAWTRGLLLGGGGLVIALGAFSTLLRRRVRVRTEELATRNKELVQSETRLRLITDALPALIATVDSDGRFLFCNAGIRSWFGIEPAAVLGRPLLQVVGPDTPPSLGSQLATALSGSSTSHDLELLLADGTSRWVHSVHVPQMDDRGAVSSVHVLFVDVSEHRRAEDERRHLEEELAKAHRMEAVGRLASGVAHDFRNLLAVIDAQAEGIRGEAGSAESVSNALASIRSALDHAQGITRSLLAFARRAESHKEPLNLRELLLVTRRMLELLLPGEVELVLEPGSGPAPWIHADPHQVQQVLLNLSLNARDAMPDGGRLVISLSADERSARVTLSDTGIGIPAENLPRIFEPFFTTKPHDRGTGLGLAMVHGIVRDHGGNVDVRSEPGHGASFVLSLPRVPAGPDPQAPAAGRRRRAVVAAGSQQVRHIVAATLTSLGIDVTALRDVAELAPREDEEARDLLVLDGDEETCLAALRRLREAGDGTPAVIMAAREGAHGAPSDADTRVLVRPFPMSRLAEAVADLLRPRTILVP